ncbi:MAG: penicillin-binding transpeptidase domain-containing protein [Terracidiphilus sp.]
MRFAVFISVLLSWLVGACFCVAQATSSWPYAVAQAAKTSPQARIVVLDVSSGHLLAANHLAVAARTLATPGSAMKPLVLYGLVAAGRWDPARRVECSRKLMIDGHTLNCSHPAIPPPDAREALTWSCNTYFAAVAATLDRGELRTVLAPTGLLGQTGLGGNLKDGEATADFRDPQTVAENQLALLGVKGVRVTPLEFAIAYRWLALQLAAHADSAAGRVVSEGLEDSASFGLAGAADMGGVPVAGKTGTASAESGGPTHGWFICMAPAKAPRTIVAIYLPAGRGDDAAHVAAALLAHSPLSQAKP